MKPGFAFDEIPEVKDKLITIKLETKASSGKLVPPRTGMYVNNVRCSGKNQKIVGLFYTSTKDLLETTVPISKRAGLDMAIKALLLTDKVKAFQKDGKVYLKKI